MSTVENLYVALLQIVRALEEEGEIITVDRDPMRIAGESGVIEWSMPMKVSDRLATRGWELRMDPRDSNCNNPVRKVNRG